MPIVHERTLDGKVATQVTTNLLRRPTVGRKAMRDDTARLQVKRAQIDNADDVRERVRERTPAVRKIELVTL